MNAHVNLNAVSATSGPAIARKAMLAGVKISMWSGRKLDREVTDKTNAAHNAAADAGRYNKALVSKHALAELLEISNRARRTLYAMTLPWADNGNRILSNAGYSKFAKAMRELGDEFDAAKAKFIAGYADYVADARTRLNGMFREDDYPAADEIAARFTFRKQIWPMPQAADFRVDVGEVEGARIRAEIQAEFDAAMREAMRDVYQRIGLAVSAMAEKLAAYRPAASKGDKSEGVFRDSLVENVRELLAMLPVLNVAGDAKLAELTARMEPLARHDADDLRDDAALRKATADAAAEIAREVADYLA